MRFIMSFYKNEVVFMLFFYLIFRLCTLTGSPDAINAAKAQINAVIANDGRGNRGMGGGGGGGMGGMGGMGEGGGGGK